MNVIQGPWKPVAVRNLYKLPLSKELGVSTKTIERWMKAKMPHGRDFRDRAVFSLPEVLDWLDSRDERTG